MISTPQAAGLDETVPLTDSESGCGAAFRHALYRTPLEPVVTTRV